MFAPSLVNDENKPSHKIKKAFQPQVSPSENTENNSSIPLLLSLRKKSNPQRASFYFLYNCYFFLSSAVAHFLLVGHLIIFHLLCARCCPLCLFFAHQPEFYNRFAIEPFRLHAFQIVPRMGSTSVFLAGRALY